LALSDAAGEAQLSQLEEHSGTSTLMAHPKAVRSVMIQMRTGDDVLKDIEFSGRVFVKIDVEGFEWQVLGGLRETLPRIAYVAVEVTPQWIEKHGARAEDLYGYMQAAGFRPLVPKLHWRMGLFNPQLELLPVTRPLAGQHDVVFVR